MKGLLIVFIILSSSCTMYQKPVVIYPSDSMLGDCVIGSPPELTGNYGKDKLILASAWSSQTVNLGKCNQKIKSLQTWKKIQESRFGGNK